MSRELLATIGAVTLACAGLIALMQPWGAEPADPGAAARPPAAASPRPAPAGAPPAGTLARALAPAAAPAPAARPDPFPTDPAQLVRALRPMQAEVEAALADLGARSACPLRDVTLDLVLESGTGKVAVQEVAVRGRPLPPAPDAPDHDPAPPAAPSVDESVARCVQDAFEGKTLPAPSAKAGRRWQMTWPLAVWPG